MCIKGVHQISLEFNPHFIVWKLSNQLFFIMLTKVAGDFESAAFGRKVGVNPGMAGGWSQGLMEANGDPLFQGAPYKANII